MVAAAAYLFALAGLLFTAEESLAQAASKESRLRVFFPKLTLARASGERVESVELTLTCGRFRAVRSIPSDWSLEVVSPSSEVTTLKASAGHGSTALWSLKEFNGSVEITVTDKRCFDISGLVVSAQPDTVHRHELQRSQFSLRP